MRRIVAACLVTTAATLGAADARGQAFSCPGPIVVNGYRVRPLENAFVSIAGAPGATDLTPFFATDPDNGWAGPFSFPGGFGFDFYGLPKTEFFVNVNGLLRFSGAPGVTVWRNQLPGDATLPNDAVLVFWEDLLLDTNSAVWLEANGSAVTIEWQAMAAWGGTGTPLAGNSYSFQVSLHPRVAGDPLSSAIDFRYDRANSTFADPSPCSSPFGAESTLALSATIGLEDASSVNATARGLDATERGGANRGFPTTDLRFFPLIHRVTDQAFPFPPAPDTAAYTESLVAQEPFVHIEGLPGTVSLPASCAPLCPDEDNATETTASLLALPWRATLYGRPSASANMSSNGYLAFGQGWQRVPPQPFFSNAISSTGDPDLILAPFWDDLAGDATNPGFHYRVDGLPGARILTFEWHGFSPDRDSSNPLANCSPLPGLVSFQARIFEGSAGSGNPGGPVAPGVGNDRVEFLYDHAGFVPGAFTATVGIENWNGSNGDVVAYGGYANGMNPEPPPSQKAVFVHCGSGTVRYYGDANATPGVPGLCVPELRGDGISPVAGNLFGALVVNASPGVPAYLLFDFGGGLPGLATPVAPGGLPVPGVGTFWISFSTISVLGGGLTSSNGPCRGAASFTISIPNDPSLIGAVAFLQGVTVQFPGGALAVELTEGMRCQVGP